MAVSEREKREKAEDEFQAARREAGEVVHRPVEFQAQVPCDNKKTNVDVETSGGVVYVNTHGSAEFSGDAAATLIQALVAARLRVA